MRYADDYYDEVRQRISSSLSKGPRQLLDVIRACKGAYPTVVLECLQQLDAEAKVIKTASWALSSATLSDHKDAESSLLATVEGNPVLSSWYFSADTCERIGLLRDWSQSRLAFLGTPRLYEWFRVHQLGEERVLLDLDAVVVERLGTLEDGARDTVYFYDASDDIPHNLEGEFDFVFFDPPWYPEHYDLWMHRASTLAPGGTILFSLFPELTRPRARHERSLIVQEANKVAGNLTLLSSFLEYDVPSYEKAQLKAAGFKHVDPWKLSDLVVSDLRVNVPPEPMGLHTLVREPWKEVDVGSLRWFIKLGDPPNIDSNLLSPADSTSIILTSPSRRNPLLNKVNVMTSRGHGLLTPRPADLISTLEHLGHAHLQGKPMSEALQRVQVDGSTRALLRMIMKETVDA